MHNFFFWYCRWLNQYEKFIRRQTSLPQYSTQRSSVQLLVVRNHYLSKRLVPAQYDVAAMLPLDVKARFSESRRRAPRSEATWSYGKQNRIKALWWDRQAIILKSKDVAFNGLADVLHCFFLGFSLTYATGQAGAFHNPIAVFAGIENGLSHVNYLMPILPRGSNI